VIDTAPEKPHRCLSHLHRFARDRDLAWERAWLAVQKLGGTDPAELAMARLCTLLLHSPGWRTGQPTHRPPFCRLRRLLT
jgi:hypothetical protein